MFANLTSGLDFQSKALVLRAERQRVIASNIANADTPGYAARDFNFSQAAMSDATGVSAATAARQAARSAAAHPRHIALSKRLWRCHGRPTPGLHRANASPAWTATVSTWTASVPTSSTTPFATKPPCASSTASAKTILSAIQGQ